MEFTGVYHKTSEQMSYPLDEDRLIVNIKTGYDVKQVFIHYGDPYEAGILGTSIHSTAACATVSPRIQRSPTQHVNMLPKLRCQV